MSWTTPNPFMSIVPRPQMLPSAISAPNGACVHRLGSVGTTSMWCRSRSGFALPVPLRRARTMERPGTGLVPFHRHALALEDAGQEVGRLRDVPRRIRRVDADVRLNRPDGLGLDGLPIRCGLRARRARATGPRRAWPFGCVASSFLPPFTAVDLRSTPAPHVTTETCWMIDQETLVIGLPLVRGISLLHDRSRSDARAGRAARRGSDGVSRRTGDALPHPAHQARADRHAGRAAADGVDAGLGDRLGEHAVRPVLGREIPQAGGADGRGRARRQPRHRVRRVRPDQDRARERMVHPARQRQLRPARELGLGGSHVCRRDPVDLPDAERAPLRVQPDPAPAARRRVRDCHLPADGRRGETAGAQSQPDVSDRGSARGVAGVSRDRPSAVRRWSWPPCTRGCTGPCESVPTEFSFRVPRRVEEYRGST